MSRLANNGYNREEDINALFTDFKRSAKKAKLLNPDDLSDIVKGVNFKTPDSLEIKVGDATSYLKEVEKSSIKPIYRTIIYNNELILRELGTPAKKKEETSKKNPRIQAMNRMAHTLLSSPEGAIRLKVETTQDERGIVENAFSVASEKISPVAMLGMIRSCYGQVSADASGKKSKKYLYHGYAHASIILRNKQEIKKETEEKENDSWVSMLLCSLACSCNYALEVQLIPMDDENELKQLNEHITKLQDIYSKMEFISEFQWNQGYSAGESLNSAGNFLDKLMQNLGSMFKGVNQVGINVNTNFAMNSKRTDKQIKCLMDDLDYEIQRLQDAINSRVWKIIIRASADDETTLDSITSTFSGVMEASNISISWTRDPSIAFVGSTKTVRPIIAFPIEDYIGFRFVENEEFSLVAPSNEENGLWFGNILWNSKQVSKFCLNPDLLNRHAFICGMTGSGKTNTLFKLIESIDVPFIAIEPVKGEYRSLQGQYEDIHIWTMRTSDKVDQTIKLLRINPFWFPVGGNLSFHIDSLKTLISSAFELSAAMPNILEQCLYNVYVHSGWNIVANSNVYIGKLPEEYLYPTFEDLANEVEDYLDHSDFGEEVLGNYKGALLSRLRSFTNGVKGVLLNTTSYPDYSIFLLERNVIELEGLADDADKCLVMGTILIQYFEYLKLNFADTEKNTLKHIIILEEAHRLFKNQKTEKSSEGPNPTGQLVETLSNIMAEIRAFGEGMLIVDQSPTKIAEDVIKNSSTKVIHRIDNEKDIKILQAAMLLTDNMNCFPSLAQGEAIIRTDSMQRSAKVKVLKSELKENYAMSNTFKNVGKVDEDVYIEYTAATIINDTDVLEALSDILKRLISSFAFLDWNNWHYLTEMFIIEVYSVLEEYGYSDMLNGKFGVLEELISLTIKREYKSFNVKQFGTIHMFVMRLIELYRESRDGSNVKIAISTLLNHYYQNLPVSVLYAKSKQQRKTIEYCDLEADISNLECSMVVLQELYSYYLLLESIFVNDTELLDMAKSEIIAERFFESLTLLEPDMYAKKYIHEFEIILNKIKQERNNINGDIHHE